MTWFQIQEMLKGILDGYYLLLYLLVIWDSHFDKVNAGKNSEQ